MSNKFKYATFALVLLLGITATALAQSEKKSIRQGNRAFKSEEYNDSEIDYRRALEVNPASFKASFNLGDALYKQEKYDEAARTFDEIKASNEDNAQKANVHYNLGNTLYKQEKYKESVEAYKDALRLNPSDTQAKYNLSQAQRKLKNQQNNEQNKDNKDNKDNKEQNKDDKDKNNENKDNKPNNESNNQQQKPQPQGISPKDAQRILDAMQNNEKDVQQRVKEQKAKAAKVKVKKDW